MLQIASASLALLALAASASAGDWYVDPVNGNDANSGTLPLDAWRTLDWAGAHVPVGAAETIHLAPGNFGGPNTFHIQPRWRVIGDGGSAVTHFQFLGNSTTAVSIHAPAGAGIGPDTELRGLSIGAQNGSGISLSADGDLSPTLADLRINAKYDGVWYSHSTVATGNCTPTFERVRISNGFNGFLFEAFSPNMNHAPRFLDCEISGCTNLGLHVGGLRIAVDAKRCKFVANSNAGVWIEGSGGQMGGVFEDCLFTKQSGAGLRASFEFGAPPSSVDLTLRRCTLADNAQYGVRGVSTALLTTQFRLQGTIVARNGDDLLVDPTAQVSYSCIEDGDFAGINGNFAADPAFVDGPGGDYRLGWGSACIERGDPATPAGVIDLAGHARPIDGDLDSGEIADIGAFEFAPLELFTTGQSGSVARFEFSGVQDTTSVLYVTRQASVTPLPTLYGEFDLDPLQARRLLIAIVGAGPPTSVRWTIPSDASWIGQTIAFQALTRSRVAPNGAAYTNAVQFNVVP